MPLPRENRKYTYADYVTWPRDERIEIIAGIPYLQAAPNRIHQEILSELHRQLANYLVGKGCKVYPAPFHVVLDPGQTKGDKDDSQNVFEPDITIVCDETKLDDYGCAGTPDMVIEITSPSTARKDKIDKFNQYEQAGVKEYWVIEPQEKIASIFTLEQNGRYGRPDLYSVDDKVKVSIFDGLIIDLEMVFAD